jgi:hypothetical protein
MYSIYTSVPESLDRKYDFLATTGQWFFCKLYVKHSFEVYMG